MNDDYVTKLYFFALGFFGIVYIVAIIFAGLSEVKKPQGVINIQSEYVPEVGKVTYFQVNGLECVAAYQSTTSTPEIECQ